MGPGARPVPFSNGAAGYATLRRGAAAPALARSTRIPLEALRRSPSWRGVAFDNAFSGGARSSHSTRPPWSSPRGLRSALDPGILGAGMDYGKLIPSLPHPSFEVPRRD